MELYADTRLTPEQKTAQFKDFIRMINGQAFDYVAGVIRGKQKRKRKLTEAQVITNEAVLMYAGWMEDEPVSGNVI